MAPMPIPPSIRSTSSDIWAPLLRRTPTDNTSLRSLPSSFLSLIKRQTTVIVPSTYGNINSGPPPGTVVGIVLGSVGGFLLILWLIYTCANLGRTSSSSSYTESVVLRERRGSHKTRSRRASETVEIRRERSPVRAPVRTERVVVEEERREVRREREQNRDDSDEVVVIEEHSPPRRSKSKRESKERRESGYRTVDPLAFGGVVGGGRKGSRR